MNRSKTSVATTVSGGMPIAMSGAKAGAIDASS